MTRYYDYYIAIIENTYLKKNMTLKDELFNEFSSGCGLHIPHLCRPSLT